MILVFRELFEASWEEDVDILVVLPAMAGLEGDVDLLAVSAVAPVDGSEDVGED